MKFKLFAALAFIFLALSVTAQVATMEVQQAPAPSAPALDGRALMGKLVDALGGGDVLGTIRSERTKDKRETKTPYGTAQLNVETTMVYPNRLYMKTESVSANDPSKQAVTSIVGYGPNAAFFTMNGKTQDLPPLARTELEKALKFSIIPIAQHFNDPKYAFELIGSEIIGGVDTKTLEVTADGYSARWNIDPTSGRVVRISRPMVGFNGTPVPTTFEYSDWRTVSGVTFPFKVIETGANSSVIEIQSLEINPDVQSALFEKPGGGLAQPSQGGGPIAPPLVTYKYDTLIKGKSYVVAIPHAALKTEKYKIWSGRTVYSAAAEVTGGRVTSVNRSRDWLALGFPSLILYNLKKTTVDKKANEWRLQLSSGLEEIELTLRGSPDAQGQVETLLIPDENKELLNNYLAGAYVALADRVFQGDLKSIPKETQMSFLRQMRDVGVPSISISSYKDKQYLSLDLGSGDSVYNTLQLNQAQRVSRVISQELLPKLRKCEPIIGAISRAIFGVNVRCQIPWKNFLKEYESGEDSLEVYVPYENLKQFVDADITSQAMMNASVVLVDGNRIEVALSQQ